MKQKGIKLIAAALALISLLLSQLGCEKDSNDPGTSSSSIEGLWIGLYTVDGQPNLGQRHFSLVIKADGTVINDTKAEDRQQLSLGAWTLAGASFEGTTTGIYGLPVNVGVTATHAATFDKANGTLIDGVWKKVPPLNGSGTFTLTKVK